MTLVDASKIIDAALRFMPAKYDSTEARAMLLAIGLQESEFRHRQQINGPANGYWQFEPVGVRGVLEHHATALLAQDLLKRFDYHDTSTAAYGGITHNDILACCFARLLLWRLPHSLPKRHEVDEAWRQYLSAWRPGKPHQDKWAENYARAWDQV